MNRIALATSVALIATTLAGCPATAAEGADYFLTPDIPGHSAPPGAVTVDSVPRNLTAGDTLHLSGTYHHHGHHPQHQLHC